MPIKLDIEFTGDFGYEKKIVWLSSVSGAGDTVHLYINQFYEGRFVKINQVWVAQLTPKTQLTGADLSILIDIIENGESYPVKQWDLGLLT